MRMNVSCIHRATTDFVLTRTVPTSVIATMVGREGTVLKASTLICFHQTLGFFFILWLQALNPYNQLLLYVDANECQLIGVCENGGSCVNTNGSYACHCTEGWQGQHCEFGVYITITSVNFITTDSVYLIIHRNKVLLF